MPAAPALMRTIVLAAACFAITGCGEVRALLEADRVARDRLEYRPGVSEIYCYRTLAAADCYAEPLSGPPNRLVNAYSDLNEE